MSEEQTTKLHEAIMTCAKVAQFLDNSLFTMGRDMVKLQERIVYLEKFIEEHIAAEAEG